MKFTESKISERSFRKTNARCNYTPLSNKEVDFLWHDHRFDLLRELVELEFFRGALVFSPVVENLVPLRKPLRKLRPGVGFDIDILPTSRSSVRSYF